MSAEFNLTRKTIPEMLDEVDYSEKSGYVPSPFAIKMINFIKLMTDGKGESSPTPIMHYEMLDKLPFHTSDYKMQQVANLAARGTSKTSIHSEILFFYIAVFGGIDNFGEVDAIIYVSDTVENGVRSLKKNMEARYYASDFLQKYIPKVTFNQTEIYMENVDGKKTGIRMFGASSGLRGTKIFAKRPQLAVLDDLLSDKNAKSEGILESIKDTLYKGVDQALDPTFRKIIFNGTPFSQGDPLYEAMESGEWQCNVYPICERFPVPRHEFRGCWESRFTYEHINAQYNKLKNSGQSNAFYQELMLQINNAEDVFVNDSDLRWYPRSTVLRNRRRYSWYITTDFATSEAKRADYSVISVWAINNKGHKFWVDGVIAKQTMDVNMNDLFRLVSKYDPQTVGVEINGQQKGYIAWIQQEMVYRDEFFVLANGIGTTALGVRSPTDSNKLERFNVMLPDIKAGKLWLPTDMKDSIIVKEIVNELKGVTRNGLTSRYDDWLDTFSMLGLIPLSLPTERVYEDTTEDLPYADHWGADMIQSGMSPPSNTYFVR